MVERVRTGVPELDEILNGGVPARNSVPLSGGPGTGRSILALQFFWNGPQLGELEVYVSLE